MSFELRPTRLFEREVKKLGKKYPSLKADLAALFASLAENPTQGTSIGKSCYKIRLSISSKQKGKRSGARVVTYVRVVAETVYLLDIYDKSEKETISDAELDAMLESIGEVGSKKD